ncbi:MAG: hypothetical protein ACW99G_12840 [Candidatus Thorarchaeota archaeon]
MIANATTLAIELLNYYKEAWTKPMPKVTPEKAALDLRCVFKPVLGTTSALAPFGLWR